MIEKMTTDKIVSEINDNWLPEVSDRLLQNGYIQEPLK